MLHVYNVGGTSPIEDSSVEANPIEAMPPIAKRARLGSLTKPSDVDAQAFRGLPAVSEPNTSRPGHCLDYYFKTKTANISAAPVNMPKLTLTCSMSIPSHCPTSLPTSEEPTLPKTVSAVTGVPSESPSAAQASASLILPQFSVDGLTRSQRLFSLTTNIDARALVIKESEEFYLFMNMRAEFKWVSHEMMSKRWVEAMGEYNKRLITKCGLSAILKHPLALLRKLSELEPRLMNRIMKGDYKCKY